MKTACSLVLFFALCNTVQAKTSAYTERPPAGMAWGWQGGVLFAFDKAVLRDSEWPLLDNLADVLLLNPHAQILLTGHTDNSGKLAYNHRLSQKRTMAVADYLEQKGVDAQRVHQQWVGEQRPVASNQCRQDRQRNRRVDVALFPTGHLVPDEPERVFGETAAKQSKECP
jgi:outer membrane protein OmpA-like peptidoglycan-associated protein